MREIDRAFFENPTTDPAYSVSGFWFWNDLITDDKTTEQLNMLHRIHADQPIIHARFGLENEYLSEDWFARIQNAVETAEKNGQKLWLYDENNWPSGNCNWTLTREEENREHFLMFEQVDLQAGEKFHLALTKRNYINVTAYFAGQTPQDLMAAAQDNVISCSFAVSAQVIAVYVSVDRYEETGKYSIDYLSQETIGEFIKSTHEKYKAHFKDQFGKVLLGIFMDETRFNNAMPWTRTLPVEFERRKGYSILPYLPLLRRQEEKSALVRFDYYDVISDLYAQATYQQVYQWCENNNLKSTGHLLGEETIATQSFFGADMLRCIEYLHFPGIDHLGNGIGSLDAKFVASACQHYGKNRIICEAFGAAGWEMSYEEMVAISNWLFQQGINLIMMHGFYYSIREGRFHDFPPSYFYQWKYWDNMPQYVLMANRMMNLLSDGQPEMDILVYSPMESYWRYVQHDLNVKTGFNTQGPAIEDKTAAWIDNQFQMVCSRLADENLDYAILGGDAVKCFCVKDKSLVNIITGAVYHVLVLPCVSLLTDETAALVETFVQAGGKVINYQSSLEIVVSKDGRHMRQALPPVNQDGFLTADRVSDIASFCHALVSQPFRVLQGPDRMEHTRQSYPAKLIDPYIHDGERVYGVGITRYRKNGARIFNITNYNDKDEKIKLWVQCETCPEKFDPSTGIIASVDDPEKYEGGYAFSLVLAANRAVFIVTDV